MEESSIPDSRFPIPDSRFPIPVLIVTPIAIDLVADRIRSIFSSLEYLYYPELVPKGISRAALHSQLAPPLN